MEADFSGYATKAGLKCSDGRTIMAHAFQKQDKTRVPLVWQHGHSDVKNVLGHAILENRDDGVYAYGFFNQSPEAVHAAGLLKNNDINMMSIWANQLIERSGNVIHGVIREVSLVLSGANPGALIESVTIRHADGSDSEMEDEAIIYTGLEIVHSDIDVVDEEADDDSDDIEEGDESDEEDLEHAADDTVQDIYESMNDDQRKVVHFMIGQLLEDSKEEESDDDELQQDNITEDEDPEDPEDTAKHGNTDNDPEGSTMNVFEKTNGEAAKDTLSHDQLNEIIGMAKSSGSLKSAMDDFALAHNIENIQVMFPDAQAVSAQPEWVKRRTEWVDQLLMATKKSPFSRIKSLSADITEADARARGYITSTLKKEEFFSVSRRITTPTTIYKKQKLERDDMIDITEYNVVAWLKAEMRLMLDEEIARAVLLGDGRDVSSEDKINEGNVRPIATDNELYTTLVNVNISDADSSADEVIDAVIMNRSKYKGTGQPVFFTTETQIAKFLMIKDTQKRRIYANIGEVAQVMRVAAIVPVEVMEEYPNFVGIIVNPTDYTIGADKGGEVTMFDDFDIDYNQMKYLIETRLCGALTKPKSAMVIKSVDAGDVLVVPASPLFDAQTGELTIVNTTGVTYRDAEDNVLTAAGSPYTVASGDTMLVFATAGAGYYIGNSDNDDWAFTAD